MKEKIQTFKEGFSMIKEGVIVLLFMFLILWPSAFKSKLVALGFSNFDFMGMKMDLNKTANTGGQVADLQLQANSLKSVIDSLKQKTNNPDDKKILSNLSVEAGKLYTATNLVDNNLKRQFSAQQEVIHEKMDFEEPKEGWIYAGKLKENKTTWDLSISPTVAERKANYQLGEILTIIDDVYLRDNSSPLAHANAKVISVVKKGELVNYLDIDYSHSIGGGWFMWLKVKRNIKS